jgi:UDP-glucose 4-epimerase
VSDALVWVIGRGGLLGSHVLQALPWEVPGLAAWNPGEPKISWGNLPRALSDLDDHVERFSREVAAGPRSWAVVWCAGAGVVGTTAEALAEETACFERVLLLLRERLPDLPGQVILASSAGGVYGNNRSQPLTEDSLCLPISDYGRNKLRQERLLQDWASDRANVSTLIARISNLYGPGQNLNKPQGLIAHISRSLLHHTPVHVYVSLDTVRDYVYVTDCAAHLLRCLDRLRRLPRANIVKIFSAGETVTIAAILAAFARIAKGHPRIICSAGPARSLQPVRLQFQSTVWTDLPAPTRTDLAVGIQRVHQHLLSLFQEGRLPPLRPY